ncbi:class I SAM-dependent methyltransferase [Hippea jasoniae]|uniref:class I SAM-dependent methyltransferase n=1 Tax=Hippea jasoniae TaxID=944479 RepID=UPI00054CDC7D|nr:methyltransferase domain-containing protein [Hippea jasoniae]
MIFRDILGYLNGEKFHNGLLVDIPYSDLIFRNNYLLNISKGKKILHIGFVDHLPLIDKKIATDNWLHNKLIKVSKKCIGVDINKEGVEYLQKKYKIKNIFALDILNDEFPSEIVNEQFDYLLLPDVIEHIGNPVLFLSKLKKRFPNVNRFIITTPNAFCLDNIKFALKSKECINTDHRFWFTPYTLSKILIDSGYELDNILFAEHASRLSRRRIIKNILIKKYPMLRDTIIMEVI